MTDETGQQSTGSWQVPISPFVHSSSEYEISINTPQDWETSSPKAPPVALISLQPESDRPFRSSLVLTIDELADDVDLNKWQATTDSLMSNILQSFLLIDPERLTVAGQDGARRLATYLSPVGVSVTMEQWVFMHSNCGVTLTATSETLAHSYYTTFWQPFVHSMHHYLANPNRVNHRRLDPIPSPITN